tara:strand:- start:61 stop:342 length:282 start_codon:yes stop_codon:yes gene_type:complete
MRNSIKKFNSHIYLYYEYKSLLKIKSKSFSRDKIYKQKKRTAKTIIDENKKKYYCRGKRTELTQDPHKNFILKLLIKNNRQDLITDEFFEMEK